MTTELSEDELRRKWAEALDNHFRERATQIELAQSFGTAYSPFTVDLMELDRFNADFREHLIHEPERHIAVIKTVLTDEYNVEGIQVKITDKHGLLPIENVELLPVDMIGRTVKVDGVITDSSEPKYRSLSDTFVCLKCGNEVTVEQTGSEVAWPQECPEQEGGCGRSSVFERVDARYRKLQQVLVRDYSRKQLRGTRIELYDSLTPVYPGEHIRVTGILKEQRKKKSTVASPYLLALNVAKPSGIGSLEFTKEELKKAKEIANSPQCLPTLVASFAPTICGYNYIKRAILLQLFAGRWRDLPDGTTERGAVHVLLVGDPGSAKSMMLKAACQASPISQMASGKGASGVGLTASVERGIFDESWTLKAGAVVLANGGLCAIDEFDKVSDSSKAALHSVMSDGILPVNKAGINEVLPARTSILAGMNPKGGRFDNFNEIVAQIGIKNAALLSRFDLIYCIRDMPEEQRDRAIAEHMGATLLDGGNGGLSVEFLKKYVHHARQLEPTWTKKLGKKISEEFVALRQQELEDFHISFRHWQTLRRLAEASARSRLSEQVNRQDIETALSVFKSMVSSLGIEDLDILSTGMSNREREAYREIEPLLPSYRNELRNHIDEEMLEILLKKMLLVEGKDGIIDSNNGGAP